MEKSIPRHQLELHVNKHLVRAKIEQQFNRRENAHRNQLAFAQTLIDKKLEEIEEQQEIQQKQQVTKAKRT